MNALCFQIKRWVLNCAGEINNALILFKMFQIIAAMASKERQNNKGISAGRENEKKWSGLANVSILAQVKRSSKNWASILDSFANPEIGTERSNGTGANVVLW